MIIRLLDHLLALTLVVVLPIYAARSYRSFVAEVRAGAAQRRLREYRITMVIEWSLLGLTLLLWWRAGRPVEALGLALPAGVRIGVGLAATALVLAFLGYQWLAVRRLGPEGLAQLRAQFAPVSELVPRTGGEYRGFQLLSITAGVCEEVLYRGFLIWYLAAAVGLWPAVVLAAVAFGVGHLYQGIGGGIKVGVVGLLTGALYVGTGSLLWPMIAHAAVDLQAGAMAWWVLGQEGGSPVAGSGSGPGGSGSRSPERAPTPGPDGTAEPEIRQ
jgi:membrane protease YdiL (CAAX protease family)